MGSRRRRFGGLRQLPSGRWQASYVDPGGSRRAAPDTFGTKRDAERWLATVETELLRGEWIDPDDQRITLGEFGNRWITERSGLRPRTIDLYRLLLRVHVEPGLGDVPIGQLDAGRVRRWRSDLLADGVSPTMTAKAYRLLRAILMTAVDDGMLTRNPCRIRGAGSEPVTERPVLSVEQVFDLAARMPQRFVALVLVATFASLRWGEAIALRRSDVDLSTGVVRVRSAVTRRYSGELVRGQPKSRAGVRAVVLPRAVLEALTVHMAAFTAADRDALIFVGDKGAVLQRNNFNRRVKWAEAVAAVGVPGLHFHDLRHTGNHFAAMTGASLRDLMTRMGHDSIRAALIYQHATQGADERMAEAIERMIEASVGRAGVAGQIGGSRSFGDGGPGG